MTTCIIMTNNPLVDFELINPDVIINYDPVKERFYVTFVATNTGYSVERGNLVSSTFKYEDSSVREILSTIDDDIEIYTNAEIDEEPDFDVLFSVRANNEVHSIWMANCDLF